MRCKMNVIKLVRIVLVFFICILFSSSTFAQNKITGVEKTKVKLSFGNTSLTKSYRFVQLKNGSPGLLINNVKGNSLEKNDRAAITSSLNCGGGDIDELIADLSWPAPNLPLRKLARHEDGYSVKGDAMWGYLMENGSPGQSGRLAEDPWSKPDAPLLTVFLNEEGTMGFSIGMEQLLKQGAMWIPEHDIFVSIVDKNLKFKNYVKSLKGTRVLYQVEKSQDASLDEFKKKWPDFGNPLTWDKSWQTKYMGLTGHLTITAASAGSVYKFAVDRWGNVRPDFASPHKFRLDFLWPECDWKSQKIMNGLPVIITELGKNNQKATIEQFASPLINPSLVVRGYVPSVLFSKIKLSGKNQNYNFSISVNNELKNNQLKAIKIKNDWVVKDMGNGKVYLVLEGSNGLNVSIVEALNNAAGDQLTIKISSDQSNSELSEFVVKLPSPAVDSSALSILMNLKYNHEKDNIIRYWESWLAKGAQFKVPETEVNELFRANLWHSLILPRHTLDLDGKNHMDLPYANTAYGQRNADWPINQSVYVDYMIYGLRGYEKLAQDEYLAMFKSQQQPDGRISGFANWGVYSPGQLYAIAQNFLLSGNKENFEELLPKSLKTLDWCLQQISNANSQGNSNGLILAPLNDLTNAEREWAFTQAYYAGGLAVFAKALQLLQHPRATEVDKIAAKMKVDIEREFAASSVRSPLVQLEDQTWINYVPTDAMTPRRMMDQWYPTDVDCGPLHISRLKVFEPYSWLTTALLHDNEDNLFYKNLGAANEPVYVQQASVYLWRDQPKAVIRSFYSLMACGFSHNQLTSLEHRWAWGQYYGPPSTDGAWFDIYRRMLINELGDDTLMIGQAVPRKWLQSGKEINVSKAPTYFGEVSFNIMGINVKNEINADINLDIRKNPTQLLVRFRHPDNKPIKSVLVNGKSWTDFNIEKEYIRIPNPSNAKYIISARY